MIQVEVASHEVLLLELLIYFSNPTKRQKEILFVLKMSGPFLQFLPLLVHEWWSKGTAVF